jgi:hypothetical protein
MEVGRRKKFDGSRKKEEERGKKKQLFRMPNALFGQFPIPNSLFG